MGIATWSGDPALQEMAGHITLFIVCCKAKARGTMRTSSPTNHLQRLSQSAKFHPGGMRASRPAATFIVHHILHNQHPSPKFLRQHRTIPALRLKHRSGSCGTASALPKCSIMSGCGTRIVLRGQKPLALCDRCPCFGSLFPPLAALTFAAFSIICAFGLASAAPRSPYRHLELCGIALTKNRPGQPCMANRSG
jgi:hypothetical protein